MDAEWFFIWLIIAIVIGATIYFIAKNYKKNLINWRLISWKLITAILDWNKKRVEELLENWTNINIPDKDWSIVLMAAVKKGDIKIIEKLGKNEYVATHPEKGKTLKKVAYYLAESEYRELVLESGGGLDGARWFALSEIPELRIYNDIIPLISKAIEILSSKKP